jgi:hypothetical protein
VDNLQKQIDNLDVLNAEHALARLGGVGTVDYFVLYSFISHVKRLQSVQKIPALLKGKDEFKVCREAPPPDC